MENKKLKWIKEIADKLQVPQTYNERQRLLKIAGKALPQIVKTLEESAHTGFGNIKSMPDGTEEWTQDGDSCNGCGRDHWYDKRNTQHSDNCEVEKLYQFLEELEKSSDK